MSDAISPNVSPTIDPAEAQAAYEAFLPEAMALPKEKVILFKADALLAHQNARASAKNVMARGEELRGYTPEQLSAMESAPRLALAVIFAVGRVDRLALGSSGEFSEVLTRASVLRRLHLLAAEACALAGHVPLQEVEKIKKKDGPANVDVAKDCIALADFFRSHEGALADKTPSNAVLLSEMGRVGARLLELSRSQNTPSSPSTTAELAAARDIRDRLWTLLDQRYDLLAMAAIQLEGRTGARSLVVPLQSRSVGPKKEPNKEPAVIEGLSREQGPIGTEVILKGKNLTGGTGLPGSVTVTVGGAVVTRAKRSGDDSRLAFEIPAGAVTGPIILTRENGVRTEGPIFTVTS